MATGPGGIIQDTFSAFNFSGALGTLKIFLVFLIVALIGAIIVFFFYQRRRYNIICIIQTLRHGKYVTGQDRMGLFKKKGVYYAKLFKRKINVELPDFDQIIKERGYPDTVILSQVGVGSFYQLKIPESPEDLKDKAIDHNIIRLSSMQLREDQSVYSMQGEWWERYGIHIAWLVLGVVWFVGIYLVLRKFDQSIAIQQQTIDLGKKYLDAAIGVVRK